MDIGSVHQGAEREKSRRATERTRETSAVGDGRTSADHVKARPEARPSDTLGFLGAFQSHIGA